MAATSSRSCGRAVTLPRLITIFVMILVLAFFRDAWLPEQYHGQSYRAWSNASPYAESKDAQNHAYNTAATGAIPAPTAVPTKITPSDDICASMPRTDNIMILLKTGATELYQKLPTHFLTTFHCLSDDNFMLFSDLEQTFGDKNVYDAIAPISSSWRDNHEDFELYRKIEQYKREGQDMGTLSGGGGWNLDKWKFLPMFHTAIKAAPKSIDWFIVIEADTSISWVNLLLYLSKMDPSKPIYAGSQNVIGDTNFAHGGSGIVLSRESADLLEQKRDATGHATYDSQWEDYTSKSCCGDEVVARALLEAGVPLTPGWPLIQGETVASLDWTENHWCALAVTWHHVTPLEVDTYWQFDAAWVREHGWQQPYLYRDVFEHFIARHVAVNRTNWSNLSGDRKLVSATLADSEDEDFYSLQQHEQAAVESQDACAYACATREQCVQWQFSPGRCHLGDKIVFGRADERDSGDGEAWVSGWLEDRVEDFRESMKGCRITWHGS